VASGIGQSAANRSIEGDCDGRGRGQIARRGATALRDSSTTAGQNARFRLGERVDEAAFLPVFIDTSNGEPGNRQDLEKILQAGCLTVRR
jgi:hypothetical protein